MTNDPCLYYHTGLAEGRAKREGRESDARDVRELYWGLRALERNEDDCIMATELYREGYRDGCDGVPASPDCGVSRRAQRRAALGAGT